MKYVLKDLFGQFGALGAVVFTFALAYAVMVDQNNSRDQNSTFRTVGSQISDCQQRGMDTPFGRFGCDHGARQGRATLKVRKVESTAFQRILGN